MDALTPLLSMTLIKGTLVLAAGLLLGAALYRAPAGARHQLWSLAFAGLLVLPALALLLPPLPLPLPDLPEALQPRSGAVTPAESAAVPTSETAARVAAGHDLAPSHHPDAVQATDEPSDHQTLSDAPAGGPGSLAGTTPTRVLLLVWLAGFVAGLTYLAAGVLRGGLQTRRARPLGDDAWQRDLEWHRNFFGIRRAVRLLQCDDARAPMTGGVLRPVILVPAGAHEWSPTRRRVVLLHELVHIRRFDVVRHLAARLATALYWFHPLAWIARNSSAIAREQACDEEVLRLGIKPSVYARHLLDLSATLSPGPAPAAALPMIQRSQLEKRLMRILDVKHKPRALWASPVAAVLMVATAVAVAIAAPAEPAPAGQEAGTTIPATAPDVTTMAATAGSATASAEAPMTTLEALPAAPAQDGVCWNGSSRIRGQFSGTITTDDRNNVRMLNGIGITDGDRIIQRWVDDLRLCMRASGDVDFADDGTRLGTINEGGMVVLESQLDDELRTLVIRNEGGVEQLDWTVNGATRQVDDGVRRWREQMTAALAEFGQIMALRGQRSSLRGQISSIRGQRSSLRGQISSIRGQRSHLRGQISSINGRRSSLNGEISSARGHVSSLRGQISSARGHVSSLRGQISRHRSAIRGLEDSRYGASEEELAVIDAAMRRHQEAMDELAREMADYDLEQRVAALEREIADYDLEGRIEEIRSRMTDDDQEAQIAEIERQIAALDVEGKVAAIEAQIDELDVEGKVEEIEAQIEALNVDERVEEMEGRLEPILRRLRDTIQEVGR